MEGMNAFNVSALANMLQQEEQPATRNDQIVTPASFGVVKQTQKSINKEGSPPQTKPSAQKNKNDTTQEGDIWGADEVLEKIDIVDATDSRKRPWYDILYKQSVSAMDAFGSGLTGNTPSSISCDQIVVKIVFPEHKMKDLDLDVTREKLVAQSNTHRLALGLPHPVKHQEGKAKWDQEKYMLSVTVPIIRDFDF